MKKQVVTDAKSDLIESFAEFARTKNIDRATMMGVLEDVFRSMIRKRYGNDENFQVIVNVDKGDIQAFRERVIVEDGEVEDESRQITLSEALKIDADYDIGDDLAEEVSFLEFGRRVVTTAKQTLMQRIKELEKTSVYTQYKELQGEIIVGEVYQVWRNEILVLHDNTELSIPRDHQIPKDRYKKGDTIRAVVDQVEMVNGNPYIVISRTSPVFLERLFEQEVPEIYDGLITIRKIVREPGERAKVAVESYDDRIDPVGACVGMKGARIHGIVRELRNENIDVINFTSNEQLFIQRALSPAKITSIDLRETNKKARVYLKADQVSLAIGKNGLNIKLASRLTGYDIDVFREDEVDEEDVELDEFSDEIEQWILDELKEIGLDTAKSVLRLSIDDIERRTDLDRETIVDVVEVLKQEFEEEILVEDKVIEQSPISAEPDATEASSIEATIDQPNTEEKEEEA
ncbi:MAG: transcription termination/antitermination protein NusA [Sphingobacteriia bacterium]|nr:transcription termination/antitermination protein NusA [Sphingobacteriia bacterium]